MYMHVCPFIHSNTHKLLDRQITRVKRRSQSFAVYLGILVVVMLDESLHEDVISVHYIFNLAHGGQIADGFVWPTDLHTSDQG